MSAFSSLSGGRLCGGFTIASLEFVSEQLVDAMGRTAVARTRILAREFQIVIFSGQSEKEKSISLYHEILEAMTVAVNEAPPAVCEFNEGDFERAARGAHDRFGLATAEGLNAMLQFYGFREE